VANEITHRRIEIGVVNGAIANQWGVLVIEQTAVTLGNPEVIVLVYEAFSPRDVRARYCKNIRRLGPLLNYVNPVLGQVTVISWVP
tara:strand:- start:447 stop:704 length:258 start_codon:yes stop_codon:yes gene_type:complete